jgi:thiol-disulfide isomerase/thioredoxin
MLLELLSVRLSIVSLPGLALGLALAGCAKGNGDANQASANASAPPAPAAAAAPGGAVPGILDRSHAGTPAPTLSFEDAQRRPTTLTAFRGKPLLLNLWATWCGPCIIEMPSLDALAQREGDALQVVALSQDMAGREAVTRFFAQRNFRALEPNLDTAMGMMNALHLETLPTTILYDSDGKEVWRMTGRAEWDSARVQRLIDEAEAG